MHSSGHMNFSSQLSLEQLYVLNDQAKTVLIKVINTFSLYL